MLLRLICLSLLSVLALGLWSVETTPVPMALLNDAQFADALAQVEADVPPTDADFETRWMWYWSLSSAAFTARRYDRGEWAMREAVKLAPETVSAWSNLSVMLGKQRKYAAAQAAVRRALALDGGHLHARLVAPSWTLGLGHREQAIAEFTALPIPTDPDEAHLYWSAAACFYADAGDAGKVEQGIREALILQPNMKEFFQRDLVFDPYRGKEWFIELVGPTLQQAL
jgi:predicted Zn-dependent protease